MRLLPDLRGGGERPSESGARLLHARDGGDGGQNQHPPRDQRTQNDSGSAAVGSPEGLPDLPEEPALQAPEARAGDGTAPSALQRGAVDLQQRSLQLRDRPRPRQVHHVPEMRNRVQHHSDGRRAFSGRPRFQHRGGSGGTAPADGDGMRLLRTVCAGLPGRRPQRDGLQV